MTSAGGDTMSPKRCKMCVACGVVGYAMPTHDFCYDGHEAIMDWNAGRLYDFGYQYPASFMYGVTRYQDGGYSAMSMAVSS